MRGSLVAAALAVGLVMPVAAKVESSGPSGFALTYEGDLAIAPADAYAKFLLIGQWWSSDHTYSGAAANLTITPVAGGCWCEKVGAEGFVEHLKVVNVQPGQMLVFSGGLGPLQFMGVAGSMVVSFEAKDGGTHVALRYSIGGYDPENFAKLPPLVDGVLGAGFESFKAFAAK